MTADLASSDCTSKMSTLHEKGEDCKTNDDETQILLAANPEKYRWSLRNHVHEPTLFFFIIAFALATNCDISLYMDRACVFVFNRTKEECTENDTHLSDELQKFASKYFQYSTLVRLLPSWILGIFIGSWSDKYGRKPLIYVAMIGTILSSLVMILFVSDSEIPPYFAIILAIPTGFSGGIISVLSGVYAMASESTQPEARTIKYATLQVSANIAVPLGVFISGQIFGAFGYMPVYVLSCVCYVISLVWFFFFVTDEGFRTRARYGTMFLDFFKCDRIKDCVAVAFKKRERNGRAEVLLICVSMCVVILSSVAIDEIMYLFCKKMFEWSLTYYSNVSTIGAVSRDVFLIAFVPVLHKVWKVPDMWLALLGCGTITAQLALKSFSRQPWTYFVALAVGLPSATASMSMRARLSKIIDQNELGKVFTVLAVMESFVPVIGTLLITEVYNASVGFFPGLIILVAAVLMAFPILVVIWVIYNYKTTQEEPRERNSFSVQSPSEEPMEKMTDYPT